MVHAQTGMGGHQPPRASHPPKWQVGRAAKTFPERASSVRPRSGLFRHPGRGMKFGHRERSGQSLEVGLHAGFASCARPRAAGTQRRCTTHMPRCTQSMRPCRHRRHAQSSGVRTPPWQRRVLRWQPMSLTQAQRSPIADEIGDSAIVCIAQLQKAIEQSFTDATAPVGPFLSHRTVHTTRPPRTSTDSGGGSR